MLYYNKLFLPQRALRLRVVCLCARADDIFVSKVYGARGGSSCFRGVRFRGVCDFLFLGCGRCAFGWCALYACWSFVALAFGGRRQRCFLRRHLFLFAHLRFQQRNLRLKDGNFGLIHGSRVWVCMGKLGGHSKECMASKF